MSKRAGLTLIMAIILTGLGMLFWRQYTLHQLWQEADHAARIVAEAYGTLVQDTVVPLVTTGTRTGDPSSLQAVLSARDVLMQAVSLDVRLRALSDLQQALWNVAHLAAPILPDNFPGLIDNHSAIGALLDAYNSAAVRYNRAQEGHALRLWAALRQETLTPLPFLRFDGQQERAPVIQL